MIKGVHPVGSQLWFEYHCYESHSSQDAELWYRSHQRVTVTDTPEQLKEYETIEGLETFEGRCEAGMPLTYIIRFDDGYVGHVFEDELLDSPSEYCRPDPPHNDRIHRVGRVTCESN
jgi:hypothetical protein